MGHPREQSSRESQLVEKEKYEAEIKAEKCTA